jgi:glycerol-3-phosphate acyltransferase PlsY
MLFGFLLVLCAYLLGSIPSGFIAGKIKGVDIRTVGSGNIGATNAFRILGKTAGTLVLVADGLKGWFAVALLPDLLPHPAISDSTLELYRITAGLTVILGHNFTVWLNFKGGKGIATSSGVLAALVPWTFVIILTLWIVVCFLTRYVSVASLVSAFLLPFVAWGNHYSSLMISICVVMGALAIFKHKANIQRLMNGTENKIGSQKATTGGKS